MTDFPHIPPVMCPCGCGLEREVAITMSTQFLGWDRQQAEEAMSVFEKEPEK